MRSQDFFGQRIASPYAHNGNLLLNAAENLTGSDALISLRSRGEFQRPFTYIQDIQRDAEREFRQKEQELLRELSQAEQALQRLQSDPTGEGAMVLTQEQKAEIERFRDKAVSLRGELREVQYQLRKDVEQVTGWVKAINIVAMPVLVAVFALILALVRSGARRRANRAA